MKISFLPMSVLVASLMGFGVSVMIAEAQELESSHSEVVANAAKKALAERVEARWKALSERDYHLAYQFETPAYREAYSPQIFRGRFGEQIAWKKAEVAEVKIQDSTAAVKVRVSYRAAAPSMTPPIMEGVRIMQEAWVREGQEWFHVFR